MKITNIKKLFIKFFGGGLIKFPTKFLRWVIIEGDGTNDGGQSGSLWIDGFNLDNEYPKPSLYAIAELNPYPYWDISEILNPEDITIDTLYSNNVVGLYESDGYSENFGYWSGYNNNYGTASVGVGEKYTKEIDGKTYYYYIQ